jgi:hypothetical protein
VIEKVGEFVHIVWFVRLPNLDGFSELMASTNPIISVCDVITCKDIQIHQNTGNGGIVGPVQLAKLLKLSRLRARNQQLGQDKTAFR